jgi:hypothetical protein
MSQTEQLQELLEGFSDNVILDDEQTQLLFSHYDTTVELLITGQITTINQLDIAPGDLCETLDMPAGSTWIELVCTALDECPSVQGANRLGLFCMAAQQAGIELANT